MAEAPRSKRGCSGLESRHPYQRKEIMVRSKRLGRFTAADM